MSILFSRFNALVRTKRRAPDICLFSGALTCLALLLFGIVLVCPAQAQLPTRFEVSFPASVHSTPITGRLFVIVSRSDKPSPALQLVSLDAESVPPFFGKDVNEMRPGQQIAIDGTAKGFPLASVKDLPAGDYYVEALLGIYTEFHRADGHTIWAPWDWGYGLPMLMQGNLHSDVQKVHLDPAKGFTVRLSLDKVISPQDPSSAEFMRFLAPPKPTEWIKVVKFQSPILTKFWGHPMYLGATILLPKGYNSHPNAHYPVVYNQGHFSQAIPWGFNPDPKSETPRAVREGKASNMGTGYEFYEAWNSDHFPRFIMVTFQHPCPYFDDSYAVNSANCGPFGDAIMQELIPYVETHYRILRKPYARILEGGSTGGWESLALQVLHPKFFGGAWVFDPDPIDFRSFQQVNLYKDKTAFEYRRPNAWLGSPRPFSRTSAGQVTSTVEELSHFEETLGSHGRSSFQLDGWWGVWGPIGSDGYPVPPWNMQTGQINPSVVNYMRDHDADLSYYMQKNWAAIGPDLVGKLHFFVGDMDNYYLNLAVYRVEDFLKNTRDPYYAGTFTYGRPMKGHGWHPMSWANLLRDMATQVQKDAPAGTDNSQWTY